MVRGKFLGKLALLFGIGNCAAASDRWAPVDLVAVDRGQAERQCRTGRAETHLTFTEEAPMPTHAPLAPQIEQFIHDNPQGVLTSFRRSGMPQLSIVTVYPRDGAWGSPSPRTG